MPEDCPHGICRRARRCRGRRATCAAFPGEVLPACLAEGFEALHAPVARWSALMEAVAGSGARSAGPGSGPGRRPPGP